MTAFDHVIVLLSFVYALALTHLLSRIGGLIANSQRVTWSWLLGLAIANALLNLLINWLALLGFRDQTSWTALDVAIQLAMAITLYFACYMALPEIPSEGPIDLEGIFWKQRRRFYSTILAVAVVSFVDNLEFLKTSHSSLALVSNIAVVLLVPPIVFAIVSRDRRIQLGLGIVFFIGVLAAFGTTTWKLG